MSDERQMIGRLQCVKQAGLAATAGLEVSRLCLLIYRKEAAFGDDNRGKGCRDLWTKNLM